MTRTMTETTMETYESSMARTMTETTMETYQSSMTRMMTETTMETYQSSMTRSTCENYHIVVKNLAHCTSEEDVMDVFRKYGVKYVKIEQKKSKGTQAFLKFISLDCANIVFDSLRANSICLHDKQLKLQYTDYYDKSKMVIAPPVAMNERNSIHSILPIEMISKIIDHLPYDDQARLERVSKLWRLASLSSHSRMKHIEINWRWPSSWFGVEFTRKCFYWLINRSKQYVWSLKLTEYFTTLYDLSELLRVAVRSCPNLNEVNLREVMLTPEMAEDLYVVAPRLTALTLGTSTDPVEPELIKVFKEAKKLVKLELVDSTITGESLTFLNTDLESLIIDHCYHVKSSHMCEAIERLRSLQHLELNACIKLDDSTLRALACNTYISKTMETLKLSYLPNPILDYDGDLLPLYDHHEWYIECKPSPNLMGILLLKRYTNIKRLAFKFCGWVTKEVVNEIAENLPQLEYLDLSGCTNIIGIFSLNPLAKLKNITAIRLNHLHYSIDGSILQELVKLKEISCRNSLGFNDKAICAAITNCPNLSKIIVEDCHRIGEPAILCALSTIRDNNRTLPLTMYVADSGVCACTKFKSNNILTIFSERITLFNLEVSVP